MKKDQIKKDPIRDNIINSYNYIANNQKLFLFITLGFIGVLIMLVLFNNNKASKLYNSNKLSGSAQYLYVLSEKSNSSDMKLKSIEMFDEILNGSYSAESVNQAIIYKMKELIDNGDNIDSILKSFQFSSEDDFLNSMYHTLVGNYYYNNNSFDSAVKSYKLALKSYASYKDILIDTQLSLLKAYIELNDIANANKIYKSIDYSSLSAPSKDKLDVFYSQYSSKLK